jgi:two-component system cell cycle sensor histidine kinase/response regulator CckA
LSGDRVVSAVLLASDITDRNRANEERAKMQKLEGIGTLAGGIAHDFNNLLTGLFGNISMALGELAENHPATLLLNQASVAMDRATRLTKQLLTFSKGGGPVKEILDMRGLVNESISFNLSGSNVKPVLQCPEDLWLVNVDKGQIHQVLSNLTINAIQASADGGHLYFTLENIELETEELVNLETGRYIRVTVRDEGIGIDPKDIEQVFDPYFTTKHTGSGLGLTTIFSIINKHGGVIYVESELGEGTIFTLLLPAVDSQQTPKIERHEAEPSPAALSARVLVMDDEEMIRNLAKNMLHRLGCSSEVVEDGHEAIEAYKRALEEAHPFDAVLMDLTIPGGIGGKDAVLAILAIDPQARCIVSSGYANDPIFANHEEFGFCGVLEKPYNLGNLAKVIRQVLGQ